MVPALLRTLYLFGPLMALSLILMPVRRRLAWSLWCVAASITAFHWIGFLSAQENNASEVGLFGIAIWTPLIFATGLAGLLNDRWRGWHANPLISQGVMCVICTIPSLIAFFLVGSAP
ncbi:MAG: hypothetical protein AAF412_00015 [Pseudomonadota bacterium]